MQQGPRVAVIGLDCATPQLLFRDLVDEIPNIRKLMGEAACTATSRASRRRSPCPRGRAR